NIAQIATLEAKAQEEERNVYRYRLALQNINRRLAETGTGSGVSNNAKLLQVRDQINNLTQEYRSTGNPSIQHAIDSLRNVQIELASASTSFSQDGESITRQDLVEEKAQLRIELSVAERSLN